MQSDIYKVSNSDNGEFMTPYGNLDSSSGAVGGNSQDDAWFLTLDGEYGWRQGGPNNIRYMVGLKGQFLDWKRTAEQSLSSSQDYIGEESSTFYSIGPKVGVSFERPISSSGNFSVFGGISGGVMLGHLDQEFDLSSNTTDRDDYRGDSSFTAAPFGEAEAGFGFLAAHDVQLQLGMQAGYQSDVLHTARVCTDADFDDIRPNIPSCANNDTDSGVLSYGPFLRINTYW